MDIFGKFKDLVKESLLCKSFKGLTGAKRVLCIIALAPFIATYVGMLLTYWLIAVIYRFACNQLEYIHAFIIKERAEVRHATEAVVYAIAFPFIFALKLATGALMAALMGIHFFTSMIGYVATFGGIKFSPFIMDDVDRFNSRAAVKHSTSAVIVFVAIALTLLALAIFYAPVANEIYETWVEEVLRNVTSVNEAEIEAEAILFKARVAVVDLVFKAVYALFVLIYVPIYSNAGQRKKYIDKLSVASSVEEE